MIKRKDFKSLPRMEKLTEKKQTLRDSSFQSLSATWLQRKKKLSTIVISADKDAEKIKLPQLFFYCVQDLDFGTQMDQGTKCYSLGSSVTSKWYWQETIHPRDCMDFQSSVCQIKTHALKAAKAAEDKQISLA